MPGPLSCPDVRPLLRTLAGIAFLAATVSSAQQPVTPSPQPAAEISQSAPQPSPTPEPASWPSAPQAFPSPTPNATLENSQDAGDSPDEPRRRLVHWNEYAGPYFTMRVGGGFLVESIWFAQNAEAKQQFTLNPEYKLRDFRFLLTGRLFPKMERKMTWCAGIMYDGASHAWFVRQTGVQIAFPKIWGELFIGRTKEGFSLERTMHGYDGWWMERMTISDATIPLLADGIKWLGYSPKHQFLWNLGYFNDILSKGQSFSSYSSQETARLVWLPIHSEKKGTLFHMGVNLRYGIPVDHKLQLRSRPEAFPAPYFIDTGKFPADSSRTAGYEIYYRQGSWLFGSEYWWQNITSPSTGNPTVHGGDVLAAWVITGEIRPYNTVGGVFKDISPKKTVFEGGHGAWELLLRYSTTDLNSEGIRGGKFQRYTPLMNWYLSDNVRWELAYGYGHLDRFGRSGNTQFFQSRLQFQL